MKTQFIYFNLLEIFSWNWKNIVSRRILNCGKFQTFSGKFEIIWLNKIPRSYIDGVNRPAKFQICMSLHWLTIHRQSFSFGAPFWSHLELSWHQKNLRAYFSLLNLCAKFYSKRLTLSASNPQAKKTPKGIVWTWLM